MLPVPAAIADKPDYEAVERLLRETLLTADELADHWRYSTQHLSNLRRAKKGPPFIKLMGGAVRYRMSDIMRYELHGSRGYTPERLQMALLTFPGLDYGQRQAIAEHVKRVLSEEGG